MLEECVGDAERLGVVAADGVDVADDCFVALVDAEGEAADAAAVEGDEAGQDAGVEILKEKLGGAAIVPAETSSQTTASVSSRERSWRAEKCRRSRISSWMAVGMSYKVFRRAYSNRRGEGTIALGVPEYLRFGACGGV